MLQVGPNIIAMYPSTSTFVAIGQLAIVILVMFSYPLQVHPCRNCLDKVFHHKHKHVPIPRPDTVDDEDELSDEVEDEHASLDMSDAKHIVLTVGIVTLGFLVAFFVNDLQLGKSFVSTLTDTLTGLL